jgi:hypothetical protein
MESSVNPFDEFDPDVRTDVEGLMHLGYLSADVTFCGHHFGLRTLRVAEELAAGKVSEPFRDTIKEPHALISATVGLSLLHVDGDETFCPKAGPDQVAFAKARFQYVSDNWFWPTVDFLYGEYTKLLERQIEAVRAMQDFSGRSLSTRMPSPGSSTEQGTFSAPMSSETPDSAS